MKALKPPLLIQLTFLMFGLLLIWATFNALKPAAVAAHKVDSPQTTTQRLNSIGVPDDLVPDLNPDIASSLGAAGVDGSSNLGALIQNQVSGAGIPASGAMVPQGFGASGQSVNSAAPIGGGIASLETTVAAVPESTSGEDGEADGPAPDGSSADGSSSSSGAGASGDPGKASKNGTDDKDKAKEDAKQDKKDEKAFQDKFNND